MNISDRIIQYLDKKDITKYRFYKETGLSNGFLDKKGNIGSDKCEIISSCYSDLSMEWLITGNGSMLKDEPILTVKEPFQVYEVRPGKDEECPRCIEKKLRITELKEMISVQKDLINELKKQR